MPDGTATSNTTPLIDMHVHVGLLGDEWPDLGGFSHKYQRELVFDVFIKYARLGRDDITDRRLRDRTLEVFAATRLDKVVCLALDPIYDTNGQRRAELSHFWVDNRYIIEKLQPQLPDKILLGASVHPYDPAFQQRVTECVDAGAVLLKWLPSAQQIDLSDPRVRDAMTFLATAKGGKPLPLLLHVGPEHAIPPHDTRAHTYDFLSWSAWERFTNRIFNKPRCFTPPVKAARASIDHALAAGATIIFAHCGAAYYADPLFAIVREHSDFDVVCSYLERTHRGEFEGKCYADVSAFVCPTRVPLHGKLKKLPAELLLFGSDFPVPIVELSAGPQEWWRDFKAILETGKLDRLIIPQDNLLDVNYREMTTIFGADHPIFTNFAALIA